MWSAAGCFEKQTNLLLLFSSSVALSSSLSAILIKITPRKKTPSLCVYACVCVCVCGWVGGCVWVCVCVFVEVHSPWRLHLSGSVGMPRNRSAMLCWRPFFCVPSFSITTLEWRPKPFYLAALFCSHNRSGLSHDLTSARLAFIKIRPSFTIIRHRLRSAQYRKPIYLWRQALTRGVAM